MFQCAGHGRLGRVKDGASGSTVPQYLAIKGHGLVALVVSRADWMNQALDAVSEHAIEQMQLPALSGLGFRFTLELGHGRIGDRLEA